MAKKLSKAAERKLGLAKYASDIRKLSLSELNKLSLDMNQRFIDRFPNTWKKEFEKYDKRKILISRIEELKTPDAQKIEPNQSLFEELSKNEVSSTSDRIKELSNNIESLSSKLSNELARNSLLRVENNKLKENFERRSGSHWDVGINLGREVLMVDEIKASSIQEKWDKISQEYLDKL